MESTRQEAIPVPVKEFLDHQRSLWRRRFRVLDNVQEIPRSEVTCSLYNFVYNKLFMIVSNLDGLQLSSSSFLRLRLPYILPVCLLHSEHTGARVVHDTMRLEAVFAAVAIYVVV